MKIIGRGSNGYICELSNAELEALIVPRWDASDEPRIGGEVDVLKRLQPTVEYERDRKTVPHMAALIRKAADELEKAFEAT